MAKKQKRKSAKRKEKQSKWKKFWKNHWDEVFLVTTVLSGLFFLLSGLGVF